MAYRKTLTLDPVRRTRTDWVHEDGKVTIATTQDVSEAAHHARALANDWRPGQMIGDTQRHIRKVAEIPNNIFYELQARFGRMKDNPEDWKRWLNDPDNRDFRAIGGRI